MPDSRRGHDLDVLVVGAGPVGIAAAHELVRRGLRVRLVDQAAGPAVTSRALATHARTLEIFDQMGVLDRLLPIGKRVAHFTVHQRGRQLVRFDTNYSALPTRFPYSVMVDQVTTEGVLRDRVGELGVRVEWSVALTDFEQDGHEVTVLLRHPGGRVETFTVPWLIGADGGHSAVRKQLGLPLLGDSTQIWLNADVLLDAPLSRDSNHLVHTGNGALLLVPFPEPGKWRIVDTVDVDGVDNPEVVRRRLAAKLGRALRYPVNVSSPSWVSAFTVQQRMIQQMRVGRCFLAGDAAHVHSPASGQGMNTGLQDAFNLSWKLADVVRGFAGPELLDSYGAERVPVGAALLKSTRTATGLVALRDFLAPVLLPIGLGIVNLVGPLKRKIENKIIRGFCGLSLHYRDSPLTIATEPPRESAIQPGDRVGCTAHQMRASAGWRELVEQLRDPRWILLIFPGDETELLVRHDGPAMAVRTVIGDGEPGPILGPLPDPDGVLRRAFGARPGECALIRPDGYLAGIVRIENVLQLTGTLPGLLRRSSAGTP
jgi:NADPH-dependent dioxygenase